MWKKSPDCCLQHQTLGHRHIPWRAVAGSRHSVSLSRYELKTGRLCHLLLSTQSKVGRMGRCALFATQDVHDAELNDDPARTTLRLLGWDEVCAHVSQFASTSMGKARLQHIDIPATYDETDLLQSETRAAFTFLFVYFANINLGRVHSDLVQTALQRAAKGGLIDGEGLYSILRMLVVAQETKRSFTTCIREASSETIEAELKPILSIWRSLTLPLHLIKRLSNALDDAGSLQDSARSDLSEVRSRYRSLKNRLETKLRGMGGEVTMRAGRVCLMVPLDSSSASSGLVISTNPKEGVVYIEPKGAIEMNNQLAAAWGETKSVEESVLWELTNECASDISDLQDTLEAVTHLDVVTAKAQYTRWISGCFPSFQDVPEYTLFDPRGSRTQVSTRESPEMLVRLLGLQHPLLLGKHFEQKEALARQNRLKRLGGGHREMVVEKPPVPLDIIIGMDTRAVMITGPNTGGKTATLKSFGLTVLMAKAGLGIPAQSDALLPRYSTVLADIGDEQNLASSLSTFSGHLKRIQALREIADGDCLVLLDELGTGSNPEEGASLGAALVKRLVQRGIGGALTTLATTHHRLLANLAYDKNLPSIVNASVEFDEELMAPTYRLMMGVPGRSNALAIASRLGMNPVLLEEASRRVGKEKISADAVAAELQRVTEENELQNSELTRLTESLRKTQAECAEMRRSYSALQKNFNKKEQSIYGKVISNARQRLGRIQKPKVQQPSKKKSISPKGSQRKHRRPKKLLLTPESDSQTYEENISGWVPSVGEMVYVSKLKRNARIKEMGSGKRVLIETGHLDIVVASSDVFPMK